MGPSAGPAWEVREVRCAQIPKRGGDSGDEAGSPRYATARHRFIKGLSNRGCDPNSATTFAE